MRLATSLVEMAAHNPIAQFTAKHPPKPVPLVTYWQIQSAGGGKTITCAGYETADGLEIRVQYCDEDVIASKPFHGPDARRLMEAYALEARTEIENNPPTASW